MCIFSYWDVCVDNLPIGAFRHRLISAADAKRLIDQAMERNALLCLADERHLDPYGKFVFRGQSFRSP